MLIAIDGCIGIGKTTLSENLSKHIGAKLVLEQFENNPFLELFHLNQQRYGLHVQLCFAMLQQSNILESFAADKNIVMDFCLTKTAVFTDIFLEPSERGVFEPVFNYLVESCPNPDVIVLLDGTLGSVKRNIERRKRPSDELIADSFLERCLVVYREYYSVFDQVPVIQKNVEQFDVTKTEDLSALMESVEEAVARK